MSDRNTLFALGTLLATPGALQALEASGETPLTYLSRHLLADWGDLDEDDWRANENALKHGARLLSSYKLMDRTKLWIITEADRSATTILLASEY